METTEKENIKKLGEMLSGEWGYITGVEVLGDVRQRLMDMGIIEGARIEMIRPAPLGDPLQYKVFNTLVAIRKTDADNITVECHGTNETGSNGRRNRFGWKSQ